MSNAFSEGAMVVASIVNDSFSGDELAYDFSGGGIAWFLILVLGSVIAGFLSRKVVFPRLMDLLSKTDRIDGKTLFAPRSLGWMIGLLVMWQAVDWQLAYIEIGEGE